MRKLIVKKVMDRIKSIWQMVAFNCVECRFHTNSITTFCENTMCGILCVEDEPRSVITYDRQTIDEAVRKLKYAQQPFVYYEAVSWYLTETNDEEVKQIERRNQNVVLNDDGMFEDLYISVLSTDL